MNSPACVVVAIFASVASPLLQRSSGDDQASGASSAPAGRIMWTYEAGG
jgi:hypothetical protein